MRKKSVAVCVLLIILTLLGCARTEFESTANRNQLPMAKAGSGVITLGLYNPNGKIEEKNIFHISQGEVFYKYVAFSSFVNHNQKYLLTVTDNFNQTPFSINGKTMLTYEFNLKSNETIDIPVKIHNLQQGFHEIDFFIFKSPHITMDKEDINMANSLQQVYAIRCNVIINSQEVIRPQITTKQYVYYFNQNNIFEGILNNKNIIDKKVWLFERVHKNKIEYFLHLGNVSNKSNTYAVISFLDWKQVPVTDNINVLYLNLNKNEEKVYDCSISIPKSEKTRLNFVSLIIPNPFSSLDNPLNVGTVDQSLRTTFIITK